MMQAVEQYELAGCLIDCTNTTIRVFEAKSGKLLMCYYVESNDVAIEVKEGYLCIGNIHCSTRLKQLSIQLSARCSQIRFLRSQGSVALILRKPTKKAVWDYTFALEHTPVSLAVRDGVLSVSFPASYAVRRKRVGVVAR